MEYTQLLKKERNLALGCTEPGAVAYAAALVGANMEGEAEYIKIRVSGNVLKNALNVGIPGTQLKGIQIAAALGVLVGDPDKKLEGLSFINIRDIERAEEFLKAKRVQIQVEEGVEKLYIHAFGANKKGTAEVQIKREHTNVTIIKKNGTIVYEKKMEEGDQKEESEKIFYEAMNFSDIYEYVCQVSEEKLNFLDETIEVNKKLSIEGLTKKYGLGVGKALGQTEKSKSNKQLLTYILTRTVAAIDARMGGCPLPVVALNGSGNQGLASSLPVIYYGEFCGNTKSEIKRALLLSQLVTVYIKQKTGKLSSLCGSALAAGAGMASGMTYLQGGKQNEIKHSLENVVADLSGMICDGAKAGCSLKIATAVNSAYRSSYLAMNQITVSNTDGIIGRSVDETINNLGRLSKEGMNITDETILKIMTKSKED